MRMVARMAALAAFGILGANIPASAVVTDWYVDHSTIYYGDNIVFSTAEAGGELVSHYMWQSTDDLTAGWSTFKEGDGSAMGFQETYAAVGKSYIRLYVTYAPDDNGVTHEPTTIDHSITGLAPNGMRIISGKNSNTPINDNAIITFVMTTPTGDVGPDGDIYWTQEMITSFDSKQSASGTVLTTTLNVWSPPEGGDNTEFYAEGSNVIDEKPFTDNSVWVNTPNDTWVVKYTQKVRVSLFTLPIDILDLGEWYELGSFDFLVWKVDASTFQIR